ncbi:MAG: stage II sporulation protein M [Methanomicrobiales archaeon]|nr:stage II sporulation protein M [Methanomicrobiales archaeon]MDI6876380.1 stage II sporulation protein M [Methanomicrobiales archaeon]
MDLPPIRYAVLLVSLLLGITLLLGVVLASDDLAVAKGFRDRYTSSISTRILHAYAANIHVTFLMIFGGNLLLNCMLFLPARLLQHRSAILLPIFVTAVVGYNGLMVGSIVYLCAVQRGLTIALAAVLPHGIIELSAMILAAALGLTYAFRYLQDERRGEREFRPYADAFMALVTPMVAVAALIETYLTHLIVYSMV